MTHKETINHARTAVKPSGGRTKHYKINEMTGINIHLYSYLNENGPHRLTETGTNGYGLAIVGMALLEEANHYGAGFEVSNAQVQSSMPLSMWPVEPNVEAPATYFSSTMSACMLPFFLS